VRAATPDDVALARDLMIPMRDGVKLAADVYRPARSGVPIEGRFPALLMRTPYDKEVRAAPFAQYFASRGYVVVVQDVRARYKSQGHWRPLYDDGVDGYDTTQWIGHQPWSDGGIGTVGTSYEGGTQHALAIADAPFVKAMIPLFSMSDVGRYGLRHNGAFELRRSTGSSRWETRGPAEPRGGRAQPPAIRLRRPRLQISSTMCPNTCVPCPCAPATPPSSSRPTTKSGWRM